MPAKPTPKCSQAAIASTKASTISRLAKDGDENAVQFRKGFFLGDGTGSGKGRQAAGIILDNWLRGRRKAVWISKSDKLIEDAQRDWSALGQEKLLIVPQSRYRQGTPIRIAEGILFTTYATLRSSEREGKSSRLKQILDWLGPDYDGVILFDEAHAMANAAGEKSERGDKAPSQQGRAGLRLQHALPQARIVYISATGATSVHNLAYAQRLGLWGGSDFPFANRADFVAAVEAGGIATMEVLARDLKALGLYIARSLSYEGIEVEIVEHELTSEQIRIYDAYAEAFQIIHANLEAALKAVNITGESGTLNGQAKAAAKSAFESNKQRFFNHLITAMKTPTLLRSIAADLERGDAAVVQLVSTGESLMERRLAEIPVEEWGDLSIDVTPREYVLDYLAKGFPTQLYERYADEEGNILSRPVVVDGQPVQSREAVEIRDRLIEKLASLAARADRARSNPASLRHGPGRRSDGPQPPHRQESRRRSRAARRRKPPRLREPRRDAKLHGRQEAHPRLLGRGRHRAQLSRRSFGAEPEKARPLHAGAGLEGRHRHSGPWPLEPHQSGAAAAVPARRHQCEGREALSFDDRQAPRQPWRDHARTTPDRRAGPVPARRQSRKPLCARGARRALHAHLPGQGRLCEPWRIRDRDRPAPDGTATAACSKNCRRSRPS